MYSCASKEESLEKLVSLIDNQSCCLVEDSSVLNHNEKLNPTTMGELVIIQMKYVIDKKMKGFNLENSCISLTMDTQKNDTNSDHHTKEEAFVSYLRYLDFVNLMIDQLRAYQSLFSMNPLKKTKQLSSALVKAFYALLNLNLLTSNRYVNTKLLANSDTLKKLVYYIHFLLLPSCMDDLLVDHTVIGIVIVSNIFIIDEDLRNIFLQEDGVLIITKCLRSSNLKLNQRGLCIVEDLIYVDPDIQSSKNDEDEIILLKSICQALKKSGVDMTIFNYVSRLNNSIGQYKEQSFAKRIVELGERLFLAFNAFNLNSEI